MNEHTSNALQFISFFVMISVVIFFFTTCAVHLNETNRIEKLNKLEAENGKDLSNIRPTHWTYQYPREVEEGLLQSE